MAATVDQSRVRSDNYKWLALCNTMLGSLLATIDASIVIIAMPTIFRGINLDPLSPSNSFYLLWMILGYLVVSSVFVVSLGRLGDMFGRVRMYNMGFVVYTTASLFLAIDWLTGRAGGDYLVAFRIVQGIGAAFLLANSAAIITDAFPSHQRGMALGLNLIVAISGQFLGLVLGGLLAPISWRLIFLVSVPFGIAGGIWAYTLLEERGVRVPGARIDWLGNFTFAAGLILVMVGITSGIRPYGGSAMGWSNPRVLAEIASGLILLGLFVVVERRTPTPMFRLELFRIRAFTFGSLSTFLSATARGGLMFMLIIWLQGIWLPLHGYDFAQTPLQAGLHILPLTAGILIAGPISGHLSDRYGPRMFATLGMLMSATSFVLLMLLPVDFSYAVFAPILFLNGLGIGVFSSPNRAGVMNSLPPEHRGAGGAMNSTFQNSAQVLSIGIFFSLMIGGLATTLPHALTTGLVSHGVPRATAASIATLPPVSILFASFLGYNPVAHLAGAKALAHLPASSLAVINGKRFFPNLISAPFRHGLRYAFAFAIAASLIAALASWSRGDRDAPDTLYLKQSPETTELDPETLLS